MWRAVRMLCGLLEAGNFSVPVTNLRFNCFSWFSWEAFSFYNRPCLDKIRASFVLAFYRLALNKAIIWLVRSMCIRSNLCHPPRKSRNKITPTIQCLIVVNTCCWHLNNYVTVLFCILRVLARNWGFSFRIILIFFILPMS